MQSVNLHAPAVDDCVFGHGIAVDGNAGLNPVEGVQIIANAISTVHGTVPQSCGAGPCMACSIIWCMHVMFV